MPHNRPQTANCAACGCVCLPPPNRTCRLLLNTNLKAVHHCPSTELANSNCQLIAAWAEAWVTTRCVFVSAQFKLCTSKSAFTYVSKSVTMSESVEQRLCVCEEGWVDKICGCLWGSWMIFTGTDSLEGVRVQACLRRAGSWVLGMALSYRITRRLPEA